MAAWNDDCFGHHSTQVSACSSTLTIRALPPEFARPGDELTVKISLEKPAWGRCRFRSTREFWVENFSRAAGGRSSSKTRCT